MEKSFALPIEGEIYKVVEIDGNKFELRYGYNEEFEREQGIPVVLFPDLKSSPRYTEDGYRIVTSVQEPCEHYVPADSDQFEDWCADCVHYPGVHHEIGVCKCKKNRHGIKTVDINSTNQQT